MTAHATAYDATTYDAEWFESAWFDPMLDQPVGGPTAPDAGTVRHLHAIPAAPRPARNAGAAWVRAAGLLIAIVALFFLYFTSGADADSAPQQTVLHVVQPGDTLWDLAIRFTPPGGDVRETVSSIRDANAMTSSMLQVGEQIEVPTSE